MNYDPLSNGRILYINGQYPYAPRWARAFTEASPRLLRWRPKFPQQQVYVANNQIKIYNPYNESITVAGGPFSGVSDLSFGIYPGGGMNGQISYDGNMMAVTGFRSSSNRIIAFSFNLTTGVKGADIPLYIPPYTDYNYVYPKTGLADHDFITIDASGQFVIHLYQGGNDVSVFNASTGALITNTADPSPVHPLFDDLKHPDTTLSGDGNTPYLMYTDRNRSDTLARATLPDLNSTSRQYFTEVADQGVSHASGTRQWRQRSDGKRFMTAFGTGGGLATSSTPLYNAVFRCDVDNGDIHVLAHHNTLGTSSSNGSEAWHAISPSGTRSIFTSTWGVSAGNRQMYLLEHYESP